MRPGSLVARFRKCGKATCHCAKQDVPADGPSYSPTHPVGGKTVARIIPAGQHWSKPVPSYFRQLVQQLVGRSEQICDWQLRHPKSETEPVKNKLNRRSAPPACWTVGGMKLE